MKTRQLIKDEKPISLLGYGVMRLPLEDDNDPGSIDEAKAQALLDTAYAKGINYYDTAYVYHDQKAETFLGKALRKYPRESYHIATKLPIWLVKKDSDVEKYFFEELKRFGVDYFDFYLIHSLDRIKYDTCTKYHAYETLSQLKEKGYIRHLGFSFHDDVSTLQTIVNDHDWDFAQIQMNYFDWEFQDAKGQYELLEAAGIPTVIMEPVRGGVLANLPTKAESKLKAIHPERSMASWAIQFVASHPNIMCVLSGMNSDEVLQDNLTTINTTDKLSTEEENALVEVRAILKEKFAVTCTACGYCHECPKTVAIPDIFKAYNTYIFGDKEEFQFYNLYSKIDMDKRAKECIGCKKCTRHCPQQIDIPAQLTTIQNLVDTINAKKTNFKQM